jgi:putative Mg2+ transporter-C (MgtC) family protein
MITNLEIILRLLLTVGLGGLIGSERQKMKRPAGLRTHMLVAIGACLFTMAGMYYFPGSEASRIAAQIVVGIGFIGAGTIFMMQDKVVGLTTAASLWSVAGIGLAIGCGFYVGGIATAIIVFLVLQMGKFEALEEGTLKFERPIILKKKR